MRTLAFQFLVFFGLATVLLGCGSGEPRQGGTEAIVRAEKWVDPWVVGTRDPNASEPALLWNGRIGVRIGRDGTGVADGFFAIDEYDTEGEEKIRALENPLARKVLAIDVTKPYEQSLDLRTGILKTHYFRTDGAEVSVEHAIHPKERILAERYWVKGGKGREDLPASRSEIAGMIGNVRGTSLQTREIEPFKEGAGWERTLTFSRSQNTLAMNSARGIELRVAPSFFNPPSAMTFEEVAEASRKAWAKKWETDIEIDGPVEDQQAVRSFLFYLRSSIDPEAGMSISPYGLSSTQYNGHVFWDADLWVFPALAFVDPAAARAIPEYRHALLAGARENYRTWLEKGRPTGQEALGKLPAGIDSPLGLKFPWESSVSGRETVPGPSQFEDHITGTVHHSMTIASALGQIEPSHVSDVAREGAWFYMNRITKGEGGFYDLKGTMSPDEHHIGDNDLYTNLVAQGVIDDGLWKMPDTDRPKLRLPRDEKSLLTYEDDPVRGYKQAAAVLAIYPLQHPEAESQAKEMMERFGDKVIKNGPAMTDSVHATIWARLGETERAYEAWHASWKPFTQHPLMLFSEKRQRSKAYFTTGAGGSLQTVLFGFLGFRIDWKEEAGTAWSQPLRGNARLTIKPNLPAAWKSVKFKNFSVLGRRYTLTATPSGTTVNSTPSPGE